jgi:hypothetical protein
MKLFLLLFLSPLLLISPLFAQNNNNLYIIKDIQVRIPHNNPVVAKNLGFQKVHKIAFQKIIEKIVPSNLQNSVTTPENIENLIRNITFLEEKSGNNLYVARFDVHFNEDALLNYLKKFNIKPSFDTPQSLLVIPLYREVGSTRLWERNNLWLNAWAKRHDSTASGINILAPTGSLKDRETLSAHNATSINNKKLSQLAKNYQTENYILSTATMHTDINTQSLNVRFQTLPFIVGAPSESSSFTLKASSLQELPSLMDKATLKVIAIVTQAWTQRIQVHSETAKSSQKRDYWLIVPFSSAKNLHSISSKISNIRNFSSLKILATHSEKALFSLSSSYNVDHIINILSQHRFKITQNPQQPNILNLSQER